MPQIRLLLLRNVCQAGCKIPQRDLAISSDRRSVNDSKVVSARQQVENGVTFQQSVSIV